MLFLGAGASKQFGLKTMKEMSEIFESEANLTSEERELYSDIRTTLKSNNLERILTVVHDLCVLKVVDVEEREIVLSIHSKNPSVVYFESTLQWCFDKLPKISTEQSITKNSTFEDWVKYQNAMQQKLRQILNTNFAISLKSKILDFIKKNCALKEEEKRLPDIYGVYKRLFEIMKFTPCQLFDIFTTNYDLVIEKYHGCHFNEEYDYREKVRHFTYRSRISFTDGFLLRTFEDNCLTFKDEFDDNVWDPEKYDAVLSNGNSEDIPTLRLFKLHGSIDQYIEGNKIVKRDNLYSTPTTSNEERLESMIYPMQEKEVYKDPFFELFTRLKASLLSEMICIVIGYSFGDEHIRNIFFDAVKSNPEIRIILINPNAQKIRDDLEPIKDKIEPIEGKFGEEKVFEELKQKLSEV